MIGLVLFKFLLSLEIFNGINHRMGGLISIVTGEGIVDRSSRIRMEMLEIGLEQLLQQHYQNVAIVPCHRLDRNTSGLVIFAKDAESEAIILQLIKAHQISKRYRCLVYGHPHPKEATLHAYLWKDRKGLK